MQSRGCFASAFALKTFNGVKLCGHLLWSEASILHKDIYICCMENCGILYVASSSVRGCGLKFLPRYKIINHDRSSSMRGCGLKWSMSKGSITYLSSSSSWGCGLKFWHSYAMWLFLFVILLARRWIEISLSVSFLLMTFGHPPCEGEGALLIIFTSKAYKKTSVWVDSIIMLYTADIS